jgi:DNA adenine methylase
LLFIRFQFFVIDLNIIWCILHISIVVRNDRRIKVTVVEILNLMFRPLPKNVSKVVIPPIKSQGIKTKLVRFILSNISWHGKGKWIEPFLGSGVVLFNVQPQRAIANDINPHIIRFYQMIYDGFLSIEEVEAYLLSEGQKLSTYGEDYYYLVRERFNKAGDPLDFLFLNRACFNGLIRFNSKGEFNVPFCREPNRFSKTYVSKIVNRISQIRQIMRGKEWEFRVGDWKECIKDIEKDDFVYLDPPYAGRCTDYYQKWTENDTVDLYKIIRQLPSGFALSTWKEDKNRKNEHIELYLQGFIIREFKHFYHIGSRKDFRGSVIELLIIRPGYEAQTE